MTQQATAAHRTKYVLDEADLPTQWYNIQADLKTPGPQVLPPLIRSPISSLLLSAVIPLTPLAHVLSQARCLVTPHQALAVMQLSHPPPPYLPLLLNRPIDILSHLSFFLG